MQAFLKSADIDICPHGKTTMSPELFALQKDAGVWGMTAATAHHVRVYRQWGVGRILLATQLVSPGDIALVLDELEKDPAFDFFCLVDSVDGVERLAKAVRERNLVRRLNVLVELGAVRGRTGVRSVAAGLALSSHVQQHDVLALRGVEIFEGIFPSEPEGVDRTNAMLSDMLQLVAGIYAAGHFADGEILLTGGGSSLFDLCANHLAKVDLAGRQRVILRSGCYITHDHGTYERAFDAIRKRAPHIDRIGQKPRAALEVWAVIQSVPERGEAIASLGKRDVGFDADLPVAIWHYRPQVDSRPRPVEGALDMVRLYDQHACLAGSADVRVGDLIGFGISHPCTTFDKWRALPVVNDDYLVTSFVTTVF
jgi:D-serine dehydratase